MGNHELFFILISFIVGSFPSGFLICLIREKKDIRLSGSSNIGATNVFRVCGKGPAILTLAIDIFKGMLPVIYGLSHFNSPFIISMGGAAAITGHIFSPFLKFRGGKGVATYTGFLLAFSLNGKMLPSLIVFITFFVIVFYFSKYVSLSSLIAVSGSFFAVLFTFTVETSMVVFFIVIIIVVKHRNNIKRLLKGDEKKLFRR